MSNCSLCSTLSLLWSFIIIGFHALIVAPARKVFGTVVPLQSFLHIVSEFCNAFCGACYSDAAVATVEAEKKQQQQASDADERPANLKKAPRVAVIGGGIAGSGAAWTLAKLMEKESTSSSLSASPTLSCVHLYEQRAALGGNAKTHLWQISKDANNVLPVVVKNTATTTAAIKGEKDGRNEEDKASSPSIIDTVRTGLSVLAWPPKYFKTYESLLATLQIPTEKVVPKFFVATAAEEEGVKNDAALYSSSPAAATAQFRQGSANPKWAADMNRWDRAVRVIRAINNVCSIVDGVACAVLVVCVLQPLRCGVRALVALLGFGGKGKIATNSSQVRHPKNDVSMTAGSSNGKKEPVPPSFYEVCLWNPLNIITARFFVCRLFGVSAAFWDTVVVPIYSSSFLTTKLNALPTMILPALDDIISVGMAEPLKTLHTWRGGSNDVFNALGRDIVAATSNSSSNTSESQPLATDAPSYASNAVLLNAKIDSVVWCEAAKQWTISYRIEKTGADEKSDGASRLLTRVYEYVIFACPSEAINTFTRSDAAAAAAKKGKGSSASFNARYRSPLWNAIIPNITYENERDVNFTVGHIHCDKRALPDVVEMKDSAVGVKMTSGGLAEELLAHRYTNYVEIAAASSLVANRRADRSNTSLIPQLGKRDSEKYGPTARTDAVENIFILSTWVPQAVMATERHFGEKAILVPTADNVFAMMVSYNPAPSRRCLFDAVEGSSAVVERKHVANQTPVDSTLAASTNDLGDKAEASSPSSTIALVDNTWAHPQLDLPNMLRSQALSMLQGHCNSYYCGSYATPGNGHDLSLLSGVVIADELVRTARLHNSQGNNAAGACVGAAYPFPSEATKPGALQDFYRLRALMLRSL